MTMHEDGIKWDKMKIYNARRKIIMSLHEIQWKARTMHWSEIKTTLHEIKMKGIAKGWSGIELALCNIHAKWKGHDHAWSQIKVAFYETKWNAMTTHAVELRWH